MGLTKILFERARKRAREEGIRAVSQPGIQEVIRQGVQDCIRQGVQEGIRKGVQQERDRLRQYGIVIPPDDQPTETRKDSTDQR